MEIEKIERKVRSFTGWYLQGNMHPIFKIFEFKGTLPEAAIDFQKHCRIMGYKYIRVRPHIVDLRQQEALKLQNENWSEDQEGFEAIAEEKRKADERVIEAMAKR